MLGGLLAVLLYAPFWNGLTTLDIGRRMQLFTTSLPSTIYKALRPFLGAQEAGQIVSLSALGLLFLFVLYQSLSAGKGDPANDYLRGYFQHPCFLFIGSLFVVSSMVWPLADYADSTAEQETSTFCSVIWILGSKSKVVFWASARPRDLKSHARTSCMVGSPAWIGGPGRSLAVCLVELVEG